MRWPASCRFYAGPMQSTWLTREVPLLEAIGEAESEDVLTSSEWLAGRTGLTLRETNIALKALLTAIPPYIEAIDSGSAAGPDYLDVELAERGRRVVGAWPPADGGVEALLALITERLDETTDEEEKSKLAKLRDGVQSVGKDVGTALLTAWLKSVAGLP